MNYFESSSLKSSPEERGRPSRRLATAVAVAAGVALLAGTMVTTASAIVARASSAVGAYTTKDTFKFVSAPKLHPPKLLVHARSKHGLAPGDFLVANLPNGGFRGPMTGEGGPIIYDNQLRPVWVLGVGTKVGAADLQQETYLGQPVLTWWEGTTNGLGFPKTGEVFVVDQHYKSVGKLKAKAPWTISLHDAIISGPNVWVTVYRNVAAHSGHFRGKVADVGVQEYNLKTGKLLFTWDALKGPGQTVPLSASEIAPPKRGVWDAYHINSLQVLSGGNILVSMRNTWSVYLINPATKKILWTLGGKQSTFKSIPKNARFAWQHDARLASGTGVGPNETLTVFDDACNYSPHFSCQGSSQGMIIHLNTVSHKANLAKAYFHHGKVSVGTFHSSSLKAGLLGSMQVLPNGNALVGWGDPYPYFTEFSKSGKTLLDAEMPGKDQTYRALYTQTWVGTPSYPPGGAAKTKSGKTTVYASWNGATEVAKWNVLAGSSSSSLKVVASHSRTGFETAIKLSKSYPHYEVQALDFNGHVLGTSKLFS